MDIQFLDVFTSKAIAALVSRQHQHLAAGSARTLPQSEAVGWGDHLAPKRGNGLNPRHHFRSPCPRGHSQSHRLGVLGDRGVVSLTWRWRPCRGFSSLLFASFRSRRDRGWQPTCRCGRRHGCLRRSWSTAGRAVTWASRPAATGDKAATIRPSAPLPTPMRCAEAWRGALSAAIIRQVNGCSVWKAICHGPA